MEKRIRLRKNEDFQRVYKNAVASHNREFTILYRRNEMDRNRYGFSISKKMGKAHVRNLLKRRLREIVRQNLEVFPQGVDVIILPKPVTTSMNYRQLEKSLLHCARKKPGKKRRRS